MRILDGIDGCSKLKQHLLTTPTLAAYSGVGPSFFLTDWRLVRCANVFRRFTRFRSLFFSDGLHGLDRMSTDAEFSNMCV